MSQHFSHLRFRNELPHLFSPLRTRRHIRPHRSLWLVLMLSLLLFAQLLANWSLLVQPAYAATNQAARSTPPSFTFQQYLKQGPQHATANRRQVKEKGREAEGRQSGG
jgi:hypothetical protein